MRSRKDEKQYLIDFLLAEIIELTKTAPEPDVQEPLLKRFERRAPRPFVEFYWTATRLLGLGHLHDGSRKKAPSLVPVRSAAPRGTVPPTNDRRVLVEVTATFQNDGKSGVQRVVRSLAKESLTIANCIPVIIHLGQLWPLYRDLAVPEPIEIQPDDILLFADLTAPYHSEAIAAAARAKGAHVAFVVFDLLPLLQPGYFHAEILDFFQHWFPAMLAQCDQAIAISHAVARDVAGYIRDNAAPVRDGFAVNWFHLGSELDEMAVAPSGAPDTGRPPTPDGPFYLTVGTLEPRKGHLVALDAFDLLWSRGVGVSYAIVGGQGWSAKALVRRIETHAEYGRRLFWFNKPTDAVLDGLYRTAKALVFPSLAEGFGLPLVEAARHRTPVIASDIPVFREICGPHARYFPVLDSEALAACIEEGSVPDPDFPVLSWREATAHLVALARQDATHPVQANVLHEA